MVDAKVGNGLHLSDLDRQLWNFIGKVLLNAFSASIFGFYFVDGNRPQLAINEVEEFLYSPNYLIGDLGNKGELVTKTKFFTKELCRR